MAKTSKSRLARLFLIGFAASWIGAAPSHGGSGGDIEALPRIFGAVSWHMAPGKLAKLYPESPLWAGVPRGRDGQPLEDAFLESAAGVKHGILGRSRISVFRQGKGVIQRVQIQTEPWDIPCVEGLSVSQQCFAAYNDELMSRFKKATHALIGVYGRPDESGPISDARPNGPRHLPQIERLWRRNGFRLALGIVTVSDELQLVSLSAIRETND